MRVTSSVKSILSMFHLQQKKRNKGAMTMAELVVVLIVIAVLSAILIAAFVSIINSSRLTTTQEDFHSIKNELETAIQNNPDIMVSNGSATTIQTAFNAYLDNNIALGTVNGNDCTFAKKDVWGHPYTLYMNISSAPSNTTTGTAGANAHTSVVFVIKSDGANGKTDATADTFDKDDLAFVIQVTDGQIYEGSYGFNKKDVGSTVMSQTGVGAGKAVSHLPDGQNGVVAAGGTATLAESTLYVQDMTAI